MKLPNLRSFILVTFFTMATACVTTSEEDPTPLLDGELDSIERRALSNDDLEQAQLDASMVDIEESAPQMDDSSALMPAQPASAGTSCPWYALCGDLYNRSGGHQIRISNNWCVSGWTYETWGEWSCGSQMELPNGRNSDQYSGFGDTDAFRAYKGCITEGYIYTAGGGNTWFKYDRRGRPSIWVKFTDVQDVTITRISC